MNLIDAATVVFSWRLWAYVQESVRFGGLVNVDANCVKNPMYLFVTGLACQLCQADGGVGACR